MLLIQDPLLRDNGTVLETYSRHYHNPPRADPDQEGSENLPIQSALCDPSKIGAATQMNTQMVQRQ